MRRAPAGILPLMSRAKTIGGRAAILLLALLLGGGAAPADEARFFFIQLSDPQLGFFEENRGFARESENLRKAVAHVNRLRPAFVVVTGDLVHRPLDREQSAEYLRIMKTIDPAIPVRHVAGNHDVDNVPTPESLAWYRSTFGPDWGSFTHQDSWFLFLNSSLMVNPRKCPQEAAEQEKWLGTRLAEARSAGARHIVLFQHHPWFVESPSEPDSYHNVPLARRVPCLKLLAEAGARATFAGHLHRCAHSRDGAMEMVTSGPVGKPLGADPSGLRVVWVFDDRLEHRYYGLDQTPQAVSLEGPRERKRV